MPQENTDRFFKMMKSDKRLRNYYLQEGAIQPQDVKEQKTQLEDSAHKIKSRD